MGKRRNLDEYIEEATRNIREDRALAKSLLMDAMNDMKQTDSARRELGSIAAKYVENLQRSNEQMVKITSLLQKQQGAGTSLSDLDKEGLYDILNKEEE
jgi:hypothetical protein|tara:strand:+ start:4751 stop:5047 length:297 start_codon:yes stop_codon:yes gene_type:complete